MASPFDTLWNATAGPLLESVFADTVRIRRGSILTTGVVAQKFLGERTVDMGDGGVIKFVGCAWVIAKAAYTISSLIVEPRSGDYIIEADGSQWVVSPIEGLAEYSEQPGGVEWLLLTKKVN